MTPKPTGISTPTYNSILKDISLIYENAQTEGDIAWLLVSVKRKGGLEQNNIIRTLENRRKDNRSRARAKRKSSVWRYGS